MRSLVCEHCKDRSRPTRPIMVPYIDRRSGERHCFWACSYCDSAESWPVFTRSHPRVPEE